MKKCLWAAIDCLSTPACRGSPIGRHGVQSKTHCVRVPGDFFFTPNYVPFHPFLGIVSINSETSLFPFQKLGFSDPQHHRASSFSMSPHHNPTVVTGIQANVGGRAFYLMGKGLSWSAHDIELLGADMAHISVSSRRWPHASVDVTFLAHCGRKRKITKQDRENTSVNGSVKCPRRASRSATLVLGRHSKDSVSEDRGIIGSQSQQRSVHHASVRAVLTRVASIVRR